MPRSNFSAASGQRARTTSGEKRVHDSSPFAQVSFKIMLALLIFGLLTMAFLGRSRYSDRFRELAHLDSEERENVDFHSSIGDDMENYDEDGNEEGITSYAASKPIAVDEISMKEEEHTSSLRNIKGDSSHECLPGWYAPSTSPACYYFAVDIATHTRAAQLCREYHPKATLATIDNMEEVNTLCKLMESYGTSVKSKAKLIHIGLVKDAEGSIENWDDGTPFDVELGSFSYWAKGEPDGRPPATFRSSKKSPKTKYIAMDCRKNGQWVDTPSYKAPYACSMPKWEKSVSDVNDDDHYFDYIDDDENATDVSDARDENHLAPMLILKTAHEKDSSLHEVGKESLSAWGPTEPYRGRCMWTSLNHTEVRLEDLEVQAKWMRRDDGPKRYYAIWQNKIRFGYERYWVRYLEKNSFHPLPSGELRDGKRTGYFHSTKYLAKYHPRAVFSRLLIPMPVLIKVPSGALVNQIFVGEPTTPTPLGDKPLLLEKIGKYAQRLGCDLEDAHVLPLTYMLNTQKECFSFHEKFAQSNDINNNRTWIIKGALHSARQVSIMNNEKLMLRLHDKSGELCSKSVIKRNEFYQEYMSNPLLLGGRKFDVRAFMLVASVRPLLVYIYNETYVRAAVKKYSDPLTSRDRSRHVTNTHVQKKALGHDFTRLDWEDHIWEPKRLEQEALEAGIPPDFLDKEILPQMKRMLQFTISSVADDIKVRRAGNWKLYGCDFMITNSREARLVDVNPFPGWDWTFRTKFALAYRKRLFNAMYDLVFDLHSGADSRTREKRVPQTGGFQLIYHGKSLDELDLTSL